MKRYFFRLNLLLFALVLVHPEPSKAQSQGYKTPNQVFQWIQQIEKAHPGVVEAAKIASSPGDRPVYILKIGNESEIESKANPSVFVGANLEGVLPLTTEAAIFLTEAILSDPVHYDSLNWYIMPLGKMEQE